MMLNQPILFLATDQADASRAFYEDTLGLELIADEPFALVFRVAEHTLRIQKVEQAQVLPYTTLGWNVEDIDSAIKQLSDKGVTFERYDGMGQDERGVWQTPDGAKITWFKDPVGHLLSLTQVP
ncbi:MAG: VOC family protein [Pseudomonadota bacterium]